MSMTKPAKKTVTAFGVIRTTSADYTHASRTTAGRVRFHASETIARRAAGRDGTVVAVQGADEAKRSSPCVICGGTRKVGSPSAITGAIT